jgi:hypothetical protein
MDPKPFASSFAVMEERPLGLASVYVGPGAKVTSPFTLRARIRNLRAGFSSHGGLGLCALSGS